MPSVRKSVQNAVPPSKKNYRNVLSRSGSNDLVLTTVLTKSLVAPSGCYRILTRVVGCVQHPLLKSWYQQHVVQPLAAALMPSPALEPGTVCPQNIAFLPVFLCFYATLEASPVSTVISTH